MFSFLKKFTNKRLLKKRNLKLESGQSLVDIIVGLAIIASGIGFAAILVFGGQSVLVDRENATLARGIAKENLEGAALIVKRDWQNIADGNYGIVFNNGVWNLSGTSTKTDIYSSQIKITTLNNNEKEIKSTVFWEASPQRMLSVELVTLATNWSDIFSSGGDTGGGGLTGDWRNPQTFGSIDLGPGNAATDLDVKNKIVYLSAEASAVDKPDFFIIDATNPQNPIIKARLDVGSKALNALDVAGNYVYAANRSASQQLLIIDVSSITSPIVRTAFRLPGVSGGDAVGNAIFYYAGRVYIGTKTATGPEFHIVDVSNPANPIALGSYEINGNVNDIYVANNIAYLATSLDDELIILDVTDPSNIKVLGRYDAPGDSEDGKAVQLMGQKLYLGRLVGGNHTNHHEFHIIDVSSSSSPSNLGSVDLAVNLNDLRVKDYLAFFATDAANRELQIWNISNPANITLWSSFNFPQTATGIDYEDNIVYVSVKSNDALRIITSQ